MSEPAPAPSILHPAFLSIKIPQSAASRPPPVPSADSEPPAVDPDSSVLSADSVPPAVAQDSSVVLADSVPPTVAQDSPSPPGPPSKPPAATPLPYSNSSPPPSRTNATPPPISPPLPPPPPVSPLLPPPPPPPPPPKPLSPPPVSPPPKYSSSPPPPPPPKTEVSVPPPHSTPPPPSPPPALSPPLISPPDSNAPPPSPTPASVPPPPISKIVPPPPPDGQGLLLAPPPPSDGQGLLAPPPPPDGQGLLAPPPPVLIIPPSSPTPPPPVSPPSKSTISTPPPLKPTHITPSKYSSQASSGNSSNSKEAVVRVGVTISVAVVVAFVAIYFLILRKKWRRTNGFPGQYQNPPSEFMSPSSGESPYGRQLYSLQAIDPPGSKSWFSYEELLSITNKFSNENHIGEGGFGSVYKGVLPDGRQVAVKQLRSGSGQGEREFRAEVEIISRVHHRHLVSLVGYCIVEHHRLLVYEYVPNETLHHHLHGEGLPVLDWVKRMRIAVGSARGLAYLHEDCHPRIIHRDIKSSNILLDEVFEAQVADFGLAKLTNDMHTHVTTRVMGTFGYLAPEYASSGKLTDRSDVYSFGVVLLELITGRKPVDASLPLEDEGLVEWARPRLVHALETGKLEELVDPKLQNKFSTPEMLRMIEAAAACVRHSAPKRPRMVQVLRALDDDGSLADLSNGVKFGQSTIYDSTQYSADIQNLHLMAFHSSDDNFSVDYDDSEEYDRRTVNSSRILNPR